MYSRIARILRIKREVKKKSNSLNVLTLFSVVYPVTISQKIISLF